MTAVVLDTNIIVNAVYWPRGTGRRCLAGLARRYYALAVTEGIFEEYESVVYELRSRFPGANAAGMLAWLRMKARWIDPAPLGKQRSRDPKDDPFLACALAASAKYVATRDEDLLVLGKPFGIEVAGPDALLAWLKEAHGR